MNNLESKFKNKTDEETEYSKQFPKTQKRFQKQKLRHAIYKRFERKKRNTYTLYKIIRGEKGNKEKIKKRKRKRGGNGKNIKNHNDNVQTKRNII